MNDHPTKQTTKQTTADQDTLRAAAPDLLDALKGMLDFIEIDSLKMDRDALYIARRAVAKAEGIGK